MPALSRASPAAFQSRADSCPPSNGSIALSIVINLHLKNLTGLDLPLALLALFLGGRQFLEGAFFLESRDALRRHLKGEPQRALDRDLVVAEIGVVEELEAAVLGQVAVQYRRSRRCFRLRARCACCPGSSASSRKDPSH